MQREAGHPHHQIIGEASGLRGTDKSGHSSSMIGKVFATLDEENSVDYLSEDIEASMEFVDVYFAHSDDDQLKIHKRHKHSQVCH